MEQYMEFYRHITVDEAAAARMEALAASLAGAGQEVQLDALLAFAAKEGFVFDREETLAFLENLSAAGGGELSAEELEAVSGGKQGGCFIIGVGMDSFCVIASASREWGDPDINRQNDARNNKLDGGCFIVGVLY